MLRYIVHRKKAENSAVHSFNRSSLKKKMRRFPAFSPLAMHPLKVPTINGMISPNRVSEKMI
jgi:hypothetical protein